MIALLRVLPAVLWVIIIAYVLRKHVQVYRLYDRQLKLVRAAEAEGATERGSTLVALNQRVRYTIRIILAITGIAIGVASIVAVVSESFGQSVTFTIIVLVYFFASEIATGYLTIRDKRVIDSIMEIDSDPS